MNKRVRVGVLAAAAALSMTAAGSASAATEFGTTCEGNAIAGVSPLSLATGPGNPLPLAAPVSGVVTQWKPKAGAKPLEEAGSVFQYLLVLRQSGPKQFLAVGASEARQVAPGANSFPTRIPIQAGDRLGLSGSPGALLCNTGGASDLMGYAGGGVATGATLNLIEVPGYQVPVAAVIEPDGDGDGYGDETQDKCPQSSLFHEACPLVGLGALALAGRSSVSVYVTTALEAPVKVAGTVALGKGKTATLKAAAKTVAPGKLTRFTLTFPKKLTERLKELEPSQKLTLKVTASATNVAGQVSRDKVKVKLKGLG